MTAMPPPHGMTDLDYEAIEAAVTETVRGRWFLNEFARRTRAAEGKIVLDAISRVEALVVAGQAVQAALPPPSADPSIRLLIQRIKEIAGQLDGVSQEMRSNGVSDTFCDAVALQGRSVAGLMRAGQPPTQAMVPSKSIERVADRTEAQAPAREVVARSKGLLPGPADKRLAVLSGLDGLPLAQKLALFS